MAHETQIDGAFDPDHAFFCLRVLAQPDDAPLVGPDESINQNSPLNILQVLLAIHHQLKGLLGEVGVGVSMHESTC